MDGKIQMEEREGGKVEGKVKDKKQVGGMARKEGRERVGGEEE